MKTLIYVALALITVTGWSQPEKGSRHNGRQMKEKLAELSPQQLADLKTKEMTLQLDLDKKQQDQMLDFHLKQIESRRQDTDRNKKPKDMTADELYSFRSVQLDRRIAAKEELRSILTEEQFDKHEKMAKQKKAMKMRRASKERGRGR